MISKFEMWRVVCTSVHDQVVNESLSNLEHFEKKKRTCTVEIMTLLSKMILRTYIYNLCVCTENPYIANHWNIMYFTFQ